MCPPCRSRGRIRDVYYLYPSAPTAVRHEGVGTNQFDIEGIVGLEYIEE